MSTEDTAQDDPRAGLRKISGVPELRALAHPVRIALLELIGIEGPLTATEAARIIGGTPANAAYHLRTLAKHGYVEAAEGGVGRERPWKLSSVGMSFDGEDSDPAVSSAIDVLGEVFIERWIHRVRYFREHRQEYPVEVRELCGSSEFVLYGTQAEMQETQNDLMRLLGRFKDRMTDPASRPEGAHAYEFIVSTHPFDVGAITAEINPLGEPAESDGGPDTDTTTEALTTADANDRGR
jgi:DNA-binding transcriptional ArsR family regulator